MRVVDRLEFLKLEGKVLYSRFYKDNSHPSGLVEMKLGNIGNNDWAYQTISGECAKNFNPFDTKWFNHNEKLGIDLDCSVRDGMYESNEECRFLVFDKEDITQIISKLNELL